MIPMELDGEEHTRYRKLLDPVLAPKKVAAVEPAVRKLANELIDRFIDDGRGDVYGRFCGILPSSIFLELLGLPQSDLQGFLEFIDAILRSYPDDTPEQRGARFRKATNQFYDYFNGLLDARDASGERNDNILDDLRFAELEGETLTRENILDILYLFMLAGLDTVGATMSNILSWLARHPAERKTIVSDPDLWPNAIEELMRFETTVPTGERKAINDMEVNGRFIPAGTAMLAVWAAANLDPEVFPQPLEVDINRSPVPHCSFATGFHRCLGSHLARVELRAALDQFHRRIPDYEIESGAILHYELPIRLVNPLPLVWG
jgi:cytochrome P450